MAEKRFQEMLQFLAMLQQSTSLEQQQAGSLDSTHEKMLQGCLVDLSSGPAISLVAATGMLSQVTAAGLPDKMKVRLVSAIQEKVATPDSVAEQQHRGKDKACNQSCTTFYDYLTEEEWSVLLSEADWQEKQRIVMKRCSLLGLTNPTEPTHVLLLSLLYVCSHKGSVQTLTVAPKQWLQFLHELKDGIKLTCKRVQHSGLKCYPPSPKDLQPKLYEMAYLLQGPVPCKGQLDAILHLSDTLPARKTHGSVAPSRALLAKDQSLHETFGNFSVAMQHFSNLAAVAGVAGFGGAGSSGDLPGLTLLNPRKRKALPAASEPESPPQHSQQLALPGPAQELCADDTPPEETSDAAQAAKDELKHMQLAVQQHLQQKGNAAETPKRSSLFSTGNAWFFSGFRI